MDSFEALQDELIKNGFTKIQANSKVVYGVVSILAENKDFLTLFNLDEAIQARSREVSSLDETMASLGKRIDEGRKRLDAIDEEIDKKFKERIDYIEKFNESLKNCETPEQRDSMRMAQMFTNSVKIDSKYDNTEFIKGLAKILAKNASFDFEEIKAIKTEASDDYKRSKLMQMRRRI